jgi:CubicO group peptidase (beta-lactamase class C family)
MTQSIRILLVSSAICVLAGACATTDGATPPPVEHDATGTVGGSLYAADILDLLDAARQKAGYPGLAVSVRRGDEIIVEVGLGQADLEQHTRVTPDSVFQIGSLTKSFTSILIAQLAAEEAIDLDAPVSEYLPDYDGPAAAVPVRTLMNHTSGLANYTDLPTYPRATRSALTRDDIRQLFETQPLMFAPGTAFTYSNSGTFTLGLIVEAVTGSSYDEALEARILDPLGMDRTYYGDWRDVIDGRVEGYAITPDGYRNAPVLEAEIPFSAGALVSTVQDIQTYIDAVHRRNVFGDAVRDILYTRAELEGGEVLDYALGALGLTRWEGRNKIAHAGDIDGFSAYMAYYPDDDVSIVVMANSRDVAPSAVGLEQKIARLFFDAPRPAPSGKALGTDEIASLVGDYDAGRIRVGLPRVGIVAADGTVAARFGGTAVDGPAIPLIHLEGRRFIAAHDDEMEFLFAPDDGPATGLTLRWLGGEIPFHKPE